jgi:hypothetical protein
MSGANGNKANTVVSAITTDTKKSGMGHTHGGWNGG